VLTAHRVGALDDRDASRVVGHERDARADGFAERASYQRSEVFSGECLTKTLATVGHWLAIGNVVKLFEDFGDGIAEFLADAVPRNLSIATSIRERGRGHQVSDDELTRAPSMTELAAFFGCEPRPRNWSHSARVVNIREL